MGWSANGYVSPSRKLKAKGRTAQTQGESAARDEAVRKKHGLLPRKPNLVAKEEAKVEQKQKLRKVSRTSAPVVVMVKRKRAKTTPGRVTPRPARRPGTGRAT